MKVPFGCSFLQHQSIWIYVKLSNQIPLEQLKHLAAGSNIQKVGNFFLLQLNAREPRVLILVSYDFEHRSLSSLWQNTFHIFPGCCCKSSENYISGSNFSKIQFLGSKPKGMKAKRKPSTSQTLRTSERVHVVFDSLVTHSPFSTSWQPGKF